MHFHFPVKLTTFLLVALVAVIEIRKGYFKSYPAFLKTQDWKIYARLSGTFLILSLLLMNADPLFLAKVQGIQNTWWNQLEEFGGFLGRRVNPWVMMLLGYGLGWLLKKNRIRLHAFHCLLSSGFTGLLCTLLKYTTLRARPFAGQGHLSFWNLDGITINERMFHSFPSGDVTVVAGACCYLFVILKNRALKLLVLVLPALTAFSRMSLDRHWPSDVFFTLGLALTAALFLRNYTLFTDSSEKRDA